MRHFDLSPLLSSSVGFDHISKILENAFQTETGAKSYPPYNIEKIGDRGYQITLAVAGFQEDDLSVTLEQRDLVVRGKSKQDDSPKVYLHQGIAGRAFERRFRLAEQVRVTSARLENGLLHIGLEQEIPQESTPKMIEISTSHVQKQGKITN